MAGQDDADSTEEGSAEVENTEVENAENGTSSTEDTPQTPPLSNSDIDAIEGGSADWSLLPWILAALFALAGLVVHLADYSSYYDGEDPWYSWRAALTVFAIFGALAAGMTLVRLRPLPSIIFSLIVGLVMAGIAYRTADAGDHYSDSSLWFAAAILATLLAVPLFQAGFVQQRFKTSYRLTHFYVWSDAICGAGALLFLGASWLLMFILAELFGLIDIRFLKDLMNEQVFGYIFSGLAFGAALGVLRGQIKIIGTMQKVVMLVFSIMAVPLAVALALFLIALIFTGVGALWNTGLSATSVLLSCAAMSFVLVNAVMRDSDEDASQSRIMRIAAFILAVGIFPFAILAAISMGARIGQHGLSPERIWAMCAILVAVCYGAAYLFAAIKGRKQGWGGLIRHANLLLAVFTCVIALLLALPIFDFGAISTRNQLARLEAGKVSVEDFDYTALRWDFGDYGRASLAGLTKSQDGETAKLAKKAQESEDRYDDGDYGEGRETAENSTIEVSDDKVEAAVRAYILKNSYMCYDDCYVVQIKQSEAGTLMVMTGRNDPDFLFYDKADDTVFPMAIRFGSLGERGASDMSELTEDSKVELRPFAGQQLYIDDKPASAPFKE